MNTYFQSGLLEGENLLSADEALHCARAHRSRVGDAVMLVDGVGGRGLGQIVSITRTEVVVEVTTLTQEPQQPCEHTWLGVAPTKNLDRMEWLVEKAVEVGVGRISFFYSQYSERREVRLDRFARIVVEAGKQCQASWFPRLEEAGSFAEFLSCDAPEYALAIAHYPTEGLLPLGNFMEGKGSFVKLLIGPEGGFSGDEYALAMRHGYTGISLGTRRLRTETAALMACILLAKQSSQ